MRPGGAAQIDLGVHEDHLLGVGPGRIDADQRLLVAAAVAQGKQATVVGAEGGDGDFGLVVGADDGLELVSFGGAIHHHVQQPVRAEGHPHAAGVVGGPAHHVAGVLGNQRFLAAAQVDAIDVEQLGIAPVVGDQNVMRIVAQFVQQLSAHLLAGGQVGDLAGLDIDRHKVEVLVATEVLDIQDAVAALPRIDADVARRFGRQATWFANGLAALERLHEDVQTSRSAIHRHWLHEAQRATVGTEPEVGFLGVAEEVAHRVRLGDASRVHGCRQNEGDCQRSADQDDRQIERGSSSKDVHARAPGIESKAQCGSPRSPALGHATSGPLRGMNCSFSVPDPAPLL